MSDPNWIPTARALALVWTGPPLVQHVVSEVRSPSRCAVCDDVWSEGANRCDKCGSVLRLKPVRTEVDTVPALDDSSAGRSNEGPLRAALVASGAEYVDLTSNRDSNPAARHVVIINCDFPPCAAPHAAEALAIAFLAVPR